MMVRKTGRVMAAAIALGVGFSATYVWSQPSGAGAAPAAAPATEEAYIEINGIPIKNEIFRALLMQVAGPRVVNDMVNTFVVEDAARASGVTVKPEAFQEEIACMKRETALGMGKADAPDDEKDKLFATWLGQQQMTQDEFTLMVRQRMLLRAMSAVASLAPTADDIHAEFQKEFGPNVLVRLIRVGAEPQDPAGTKPPTTAEAATRTVAAETAAKAAAAKLNAALGLRGPGKVDLAALTKTVEDQKLPAQQATVFDLGTNDLKKVAFATSAGNLSDVVKVDNVWVVVYVEKREAAKTPSAPENDPKLQARLKQTVADIKQGAWMQQHLYELRSRATIKFNDPTLKDMQDAINRAATQRAASQPVAVPATAGAAAAPK